MLSKHVDAVAVFVIALALLAFSNAPDLSMFREVHAAGIRYQNAVGHNDACPWSRVFVTRFR